MKTAASWIWIDDFVPRCSEPVLRRTGSQNRPHPGSNAGENVNSETNLI
jgi:hypothetical protein